MKEYDRVYDEWRKFEWVCQSVYDELGAFE